MSPFVGGAFGSGLRPQYQVVLAVLAALALKRSVRVVLTRPQMYALGYRPATIQRIGLGANADGTLDAVSHEAHHHDVADTRTLPATRPRWSGLLYTLPNAKYAHSWRGSILPTPCDMRAPGAATGVYALECAMDELAVALKLDPLELRLRCYSDRDQHEDIAVQQQGAARMLPAGRGSVRLGEAQRRTAFHARRQRADRLGHGKWRVGCLQMPIAVRIVLTANGHAEVSCATSDIGTGTYTIMAQVAAEMLGLPLESVTFRLGDSTLPQSPVEGGSWMAASVAHGDRHDGRRRPRGAAAAGEEDAELAAGRHAELDDVVLVDGSIVEQA